MCPLGFFNKSVPDNHISHLKNDIIENSRIELRGIVLPVQVGDYWGAKGYVGPPPPSQIIWGAWPPCLPCPPPPPPLPTPMIRWWRCWSGLYVSPTSLALVSRMIVSLGPGQQNNNKSLSCETNIGNTHSLYYE